MSGQTIRHIAIIMLGGKGIGGVEKRFTNFFLYTKKHPLPGINFFLILSREKYQSLLAQYPILNLANNIVILGDFYKYPANRLGIRLLNKIKQLFTNYKVLSTFAFPYFLLQNVYYLSKAIKKNQIDIMHGTWDGLTECALVRKVYSKVLFVMSYVEPGGRFLKNRVYRNNPSFLPWVMLQADAIEVQCKPYKDLLENAGLLEKGQPLYMAPCSFTDYSKAFEREKHNRVVFLARLDPLKNPLLFLEAARLILRKRDDIVFEIYGDGPLKKRIISFLEEHGLSDKILFGYSVNPYEVFSGSKVFCSLASYGSFPEQSTLEALACKNALISTETPDSAAFIRNEFGLITGYKPEELAGKIEFLIDNPIVCKELGERGQEFVTAEHTVERFSRYIGEVYKHLLNMKL